MSFQQSPFLRPSRQGPATHLVHFIVAPLHHLVGVDAAHHGRQPLPLLSLPHARVHVVDEALHRADLGADDGRFGPRVREGPASRRGNHTALVTMVMTASLVRGSSVFLSTDLSSSGYLVSRWWGLASMSLSFSR